MSQTEYIQDGSNQEQLEVDRDYTLPEANESQSEDSFSSNYRRAFNRLNEALKQGQGEPFQVNPKPLVDTEGPDWRKAKASLDETYPAPSDD